MKKIIIFDLDGTLYQFKGGSFKNSGIYERVIENTEKYIKKNLKKDGNEAKSILEDIIKEYGDSISIGLEEKLKINRYDYFNKAWDISARQYIKSNPAIKDLFFIISKNFDIILVSDAPRIWANKVLKELELSDYFKKIFSGEGNIRKEFFNAFNFIKKEFSINAKDCIVVGDQEETDIIPAKKAGMKTIFVNKKLKSSIADYTVKNILEIEKPLEFLNQIN